MNKKLAIKSLVLFLISGLAFGEGTKELRPTAASQGSLLLMPSYSMFAIYGASPKQQLKIRITSTAETMYFGFNNKNGLDAAGVNNDNGVFVPNIPFRIVSPSGAIVYNSVIPSTGQQGNIATWAEAVAGPKQLGNNTGYNALTYSPTETGDYIIEFNPAAQGITRLNLHLFDVTIADASKNPILGRIHSQGWQISTGSYTNPFRGKVYPYDGGSAVYEVDFNGMQPWVFVINFNSTGTGNTGNFNQDRQSKIGNYAYGEFEVFLNPPDPILYPTQPKALDLDGTVIKKDCISADFCLDMTTNSEGDLEGFIDLNSNGVYDPGAGEIFFAERFDQAGTKCIPWNGRDSFGNVVTGNFQVVAALKFGITHLPLYDVEHNSNGYKVNIIRPAGSTPPVIFWDDSQITAGSALDSKVNFTGCLSAAAGCHRWINRGSINDGTALHLQETLNTWWYSTIVNATALVSIPQKQEVQLSFHPIDLVKKDTTVCRGDSLSFYVYNDGTHFDLSRYTYEWFFNSTSIPPDLRQQKQRIMDVSEVVVKATDKTLLGCVDYDTLHILVVDPVTLIGNVTQPPCNSSTGSIDVQLLTGPPNKAFYWQEFPGLNSGTLSNLPPGTYNLLAQDPAYPHCAADTSFTITELGGIAIDTLLTTGTYCNQATGEAEIRMVDLTKNYEYSWDNAPYTSSATRNNLSPGSHLVIARQIGTGCSDQRTFQIPTTLLQFSASSQNEICANGQGSITLTLPPSPADFTISWNGVSGTDIQKTNLSASTHTIHVQSSSNAACTYDTSITILNIDRQLVIENLIIQNSDCQVPGGSAQIQMAPGTYTYSWNNGPYGSATSMSNLPVGHYTIQIQEASTTCMTDTAFDIEALNFLYNVTSTNEICSAGQGSITVTTPDPATTEVVWQDVAAPGFARTDLHAGVYSFTIRDINNPSCKATQAITITNSTYTLRADFDYTIVNPDSMGKMMIGFNNKSQNYQWSYWTLGDGTTSNDTHPIHGYSQDQEYLITLQVVDNNGCMGEARRSFRPFHLSDVPCTTIALPNVFSPNGDGMNDDIGILGDAPEVELKIFNRWGEVIFRTKEVSYRWDGLYRGEEAPVDVYPYILDWSCPPDELGKVKKFHKVGDITLVR